MLRALKLFAITLFVVFSPPASAQESVDDVGSIAGRWQITNLITGAVAADCEDGQVFTPSADGRFVELSSADGQALSRYVIIHSQPGRIMMFIEGETRQTASGDPVIWWAVFSDRDHFRWRRYDWPPTAMTDGQWSRCL